MPTTSLKIPQENGIKRLMFMTTPVNDLLEVDIYFCDEEFVPQGEPVKQVTQIKEEEFHKSLRKEALQKDHYIKDFSTNPEWDENLNSQE